MQFSCSHMFQLSDRQHYEPQGTMLNWFKKRVTDYIGWHLESYYQEDNEKRIREYASIIGNADNTLESNVRVNYTGRQSA